MSDRVTVTVHYGESSLTITHPIPDERHPLEVLDTIYGEIAGLLPAQEET